MGKVTMQMMLKEMTDYIKEDLERPMDEGGECMDVIKFAALTTALLKQRRLEFLEDFRCVDLKLNIVVLNLCNFREEVQMQIRLLIKQIVIEVVETVESVTKLIEAESAIADDGKSADEDSNQEEAEKTLAERMRQLCYEDWLTLLKKIFNNLVIYLRFAFFSV